MAYTPINEQLRDTLFPIGPVVCPIRRHEGAIRTVTGCSLYRWASPQDALTCVTTWLDLGAFVTVTYKSAQVGPIPPPPHGFDAALKGYHILIEAVDRIPTPQQACGLECCGGESPSGICRALVQKNSWALIGDVLQGLVVGMSRSYADADLAVPSPSTGAELL